MKGEEYIDSYDIIEELGINQRNLLQEEAGFLNQEWLNEFVGRLNGFQNDFRQKFSSLDP